MTHVPSGPFLAQEQWHARTRRMLHEPISARRAPSVAVLRFVEVPKIEARFGPRGLDDILTQAGELIRTDLYDSEQLTRDEHGGIIVTFRGSSPEQAAERLQTLVTRLSRLPVRLGRESMTITPVTGWATATDGPANIDPDTLVDRATEAVELANGQLDLIPHRWRPQDSAAAGGGKAGPLRTAMQVVAALLLGAGLPFGLLVLLYQLGIDASGPAYLTVTAVLVVTAVFIWVENFYALDPPELPPRPHGEPPTASAIIPAFLPNEAATIVSTLQAFLQQEYPGRLQVILAYNTPSPMPVEQELRAMAAADPRLTVMNVEFSTSKAQNVNAALELVEGEFVGIFDADHHPAPDAFLRAWHWIGNGTDVVQGHCVIRNGKSSLVARTVAVEFEVIYGVSHPGRTKLHGFGLFGGANGFWRTQTLHETRMHGRMLTEDIDSSMRALRTGRRVTMDPALVSRELAPATLSALWKQRIRWAQGWFQVSLRHLRPTLRSPELTTRNKLGLAFLIGWRELYPWLSMLMFPVIAFTVWRSGGFGNVEWLVPSLVLASLYTMSAGPAQVAFAWRLASPDQRRHPWWFVLFLFTSLFYTELKNHIGRVAHIKELSGERQWAVTPRELPAATGAARTTATGQHAPVREAREGAA